MGSESRGHLNRSFQRRFRWILLSVLAGLLLVLTPLVVSGDLRLNLAHRLNLAPGGDIEQIAGKDDGVTLVVAPIQATNEGRRAEVRFRAAFLASVGNDGVSLQFVDSGDQVTVPLEDYDFYAASDDGRYVLMQDRRDPNSIAGVLVDLDTQDITPMTAAEPYPAGIPGSWETAAWETTMGVCGGISPHAEFISCFQNPKLATFLAGDWELQVRVYGAVDEVVPVFRGTGFRPWIGWSNDDRRLYFQNEEGIWVAPISPEMFS
jgi:hypothetical protein